MNFTTATRLTRQVIGASALAATALLGATAQAETAVHTLPRVTVEGRAALEASCPAAEEALREGLESAVRRYGDEGVMRVTFTLDGQTVSDVRTVSGPTAYKPLVRKVINHLKCQAPSTHAQQHVVELIFRAS